MSDETHGDEPAPWAMQLVLHMRKQDAPSRTELCEAAARAVVGLLTAPDAAAGGLWLDALTTWAKDGRIRKHARRARGATWDAVQELPGVTATVGRAQVRAFPPCPVDVVPAPIRKLQLSGSEPDELGAVDPSTFPVGSVIVHISAAPALSLGKAAAAAAHAAQLALASMPDERREAWRALGYPVSVVHPDVAGWAQAQAEADVTVHDGGFTEVAPNTVTSVARWY